MKCPICHEEVASVEQAGRWGPEWAHSRCVTAYNYGKADAAPAQASAVDERDRKDAERYRWLRDALVSDDPYDFAVQAFGHLDEDRKLTHDDFDACISAALAQKGGAA